jgi:hypothetical protein
VTPNPPPRHGTNSLYETHLCLNQNSTSLILRACFAHQNLPCRSWPESQASKQWHPSSGVSRLGSRMISLQPFSQDSLLWTITRDMELILRLGRFNYRDLLDCVPAETVTALWYTTLFSPSWRLERMNHHLVAGRSMSSDKPASKLSLNLLGALRFAFYNSLRTGL